MIDPPVVTPSDTMTPSIGRPVVASVTTPLMAPVPLGASSTFRYCQLPRVRLCRRLRLFAAVCRFSFAMALEMALDADQSRGRLVHLLSAAQRDRCIRADDGAAHSGW